MQKKQPPKELPPSSQNIMATILQSMPKEASITKIEYEGPRIALYTNSPRYLLENNETISKYDIQNYLSKIFLFHRRKFDIRTYLLALTIGGVKKFFWYKDGYLRTSS